MTSKNLLKFVGFVVDISLLKKRNHKYFKYFTCLFSKTIMDVWGGKYGSDIDQKNQYIDLGFSTGTVNIKY